MTVSPQASRATRREHLALLDVEDPEVGGVRLGFGRTVASEIEAPNTFTILV